MRWRSWFVAAVALPWVAFSVSAQSVEDDLVELERRFARAEESAVHLLAPRSFGRADDRLRDARRRSDRGDDARAIRERLDQALSEIRLAEDAADGVRGSFTDALRAREAAREQDASGRAPAAWNAAERELERGGRDAERGDLADAAEFSGRAAELYARAAEAARSDRLLGDAIDARQAALSAGGSELAPSTFARGEEALSAGQSALAGGSDSEVGRDGERALHAFRRAEWLATLADSVISRTVSLETFVNAHERDLALLAEAADVAAPDLRTDEGPATATIDRALTDSERRYSESRAALLARQRQDDRLRETSALFAPEEAEVFLSGDDLVLRLHGLTFGSGSDEVDEAMAPLLTKVERVLLEFSDAVIRVEGHTDSQGNADRNRALSQSRAIAIRDYLLARVPISSSRMQATGHGEDRPIARNDTEEGRTRNRRIEIILTLRS